MGTPSAGARTVVVGEALVDVVHRAGETDSVEHPGGSPLNVAYGLGRLEHDVALLTRLGDDAHGRLLRAHLDSGGVRLLPGAVDGDRTSTARAEIDAEGKATYEFDLVWRLPGTPLPDDVALVHTGSIGAAVSPGADSALALLRAVRGRATTSYDPNVRPAFFESPARALARVEEFVEAADVVKASDEDIAWLLPGEDVEDVARRWQSRGPALVVVTRGSRGAVAVSGPGTLHVPAPRVDVVDTVGAGDAFMSGLLHALAEHDLLGGGALPRLRRLDLGTFEDLVTTAIRSASITCSRAGANPPTRAELAAGLP
ncbi:carbohydrate kinase family protein [Kineococcus rhizosphaerae]|uniref:Fructokinase n=1 Tax=Kineococcus rhizosphaerae TaxID=559628 RepID=A0A2T0R4F9_9ACTN|nr:carbohydrate kinase [Kineococcus rhizosphaerae]PRY15192.1 fructokinase [Kineococcus rhizosphaerae]